MDIADMGADGLFVFHHCYADGKGKPLPLHPISRRRRVRGVMLQADLPEPLFGFTGNFSFVLPVRSK